MMEDRQIVAQFVQGNHAVFDKLVQRYKKRIYFFALKLTHNHQDAEDLSQEVFLRAYRGLSNLRQEGSLYSWLLVIAANCYRSLKRKLQPTIVACEQIEQMTPVETRVEASLATVEIQEKLRQAIGELPRKQQLTLVLRTYEQLSYQQISQVLGISLDAVKANLSYARQNLRQQLREQLS